MEIDAGDVRVPSILAFGDSHMESVAGKDIWDDHTSIQTASNRQDVFFLKGRLPRGEEYWSIAGDMGLHHQLLLFWGGSEHYMTFLIRAGGDEFDFMCRDAPHLPLDTEAQIVPSAMVEEHFRVCVAPMSAVLARLRDAGARCIVVSPPPPKDLSDRDIRQRMEIFFLAQVLDRGLQVDDVVFSSSILMLKLWHELQRAQLDVAAQHGFAFLAPPPDTIDRNGFLKPDYWSADITHANERYGTAVLELLSKS